MFSGYDKRTSYLTGFSIDQVSEFALIIAIQAWITGTIDPVVFHSIILAAVFSMVISSYTSRHEEELYNLLSQGLIDVNNRKIQQKIEGRNPMTLGEYARLHAFIERRKR